MNILVIDDEIHIREGIRRFIINKKFPVDEVRTASSGEEALSIMESYIPDIIISDVVMPGMGGLAFVSKIFEVNRQIKIIIISGFSDISYLKQAFRVQAIDYIFKPVDFFELQTVLSKAIDTCLIENRNQKHLIHQQNQLYEKLLDSYIKGKTAFEAFWDSMQQYEFHFADYTTFQILNVCLCTKPLKDKSQIDTSFAWLPVENLIHGISSAVCFDKSLFQRSYFLYASSEIDIRAVASSMVKLQAAASEIACFFALGMSPFSNSVFHLPELYRKSRHAMWQSALRSGGLSVYAETPENDLFHFSETFPSGLQSCVLQANVANSVKLIHKEFQSFYALKSITERQLQEFKIETTLMLKTILKPLINEKELEIFHRKITSDLQDLYSLKDMEAWLIHFLQTFSNSTKSIFHSNSERAIWKAKNIVDNNLNANINVQWIASRMSISPNYLSTVFKAATGENLIEYVTRIRMEKAAHLLLTSETKIKEIAFQVGYEDQNYFSKIFNKQYGISPTQFRNAH